ncbi:GNAT family N-acetyltransferase [Natronosalvus caseinilyticus]|uniref:GNAT family N-acetyltransferase n=1 Tax=Natronosalvus caseinilyticus TaxID=2953747 RepID=UPI0028B26446|nr:GNAT family N-acetyltransferase [Natronosalvus caseinilyticus]
MTKTERQRRVYPDEPAGPFSTPPTTYTDPDGRDIEIGPLDLGLGTGPEPADGALEALTRMYVQFDPADRAQGIPPTGEDRIRQWLEPLLEDGINVVARHEEGVIGHATLVPDVDDPETVEDLSEVEWELAIFVLQAYQRGGIGTQLLEHLLGHAAERGVEWVWLTVERWNGPAIALYERVGFELCGTESFEQEMSIHLARNGKP